MQKNSNRRRVLVIHSDETTQENWDNFIKKCKKNGIQYIVGDTNQTEEKIKKVYKTSFL